MTTHSPHIAAVTNLPSLILLRPGDRGGTVAARASAANLTDLETADLERYLDANRAELLFCSVAILVEGPSETYLVPALAAALAFDLDSHGVVVANISGTNFGPYRRLLHRNALHVPHVIITDGDPSSRGKYVAAGLARAAKLTMQAPSRGEFVEQVDALIAEGPTADTRDARNRASRDDIFVGVDTLEPDLAPLLADEMIAAHAELEPAPELQAQFKAATLALKAGTSDATHRSELLRRVRSVSKGRYAQRLADHIKGCDPTALLADLYLMDDDEMLGLDQLETAKLLLSAGPHGYVLAALDRVSWMVRGHSLLSVLIASKPNGET